MTTLPLFPVSVVGSLPRSAAVLQALRQRQAGQLEDAGFDAVADSAVIEAMQAQQDSGVDVPSDGEQRRDNFYSFITRCVDGLQLFTLQQLLDFVEDKAAFEKLLQALDVPAFAIKNPVVVGPLRRTRPLAVNDFLFARQYSSQPLKVCLPGPYLLTRSMWVKRLSAEFYPSKESLGDAVVAILREELLALRSAGAAFVQFDEPVLSEVAFAGPHATHSFMCAALSEKSSPEQELEFAVDLINRVVDGVDDLRTGLHVCRGNWSRNDAVLLSGAYDPLVPYFSRMKVRQLVLEYATGRAGSTDALAELPADKEIGLGVVDPRSAQLESPDFIIEKVSGLLRHRRPEQIWLNPDCGFGTFADRPVNDLAGACAKLSSIHSAAQSLRREYASAGSSA